MKPRIIASVPEMSITASRKMSSNVIGIGFTLCDLSNLHGQSPTEPNRLEVQYPP